jgi:hypothetical protein
MDCYIQIQNQVVYGIYEQNGDKFFRVRDPLFQNRFNASYSKAKYKDIITMASGSPALVYQYGVSDRKKYSPAYLMLVYGNEGGERK